jgi:hypothetical protein
MNGLNGHHTVSVIFVPNHLKRSSSTACFILACSYETGRAKFSFFKAPVQVSFSHVFTAILRSPHTPKALKLNFQLFQVICLYFTHPWHNMFRPTWHCQLHVIIVTGLATLLYNKQTKKQTPFLSPRANYTDRATAACRRS